MCQASFQMSQQLPRGSKLSLNISGSNLAPRISTSSNVFRISIINPDNGILTQRCDSTPVLVAPARFPYSQVSLKNVITSQPTNLIASFNMMSPLFITANDTITLKIPPALPFDDSVQVFCQGIFPVVRFLPCPVLLSTITIQLDQYIGEQNVTIDIQGGFTNTLSNRPVQGFEMKLYDGNNFQVHTESASLITQCTQIQEFNDIQIYSSNKTYSALSTYIFTLNNLPQDLNYGSFIKVQIPDCFTIDFTTLIVTLGMSDGTVQMHNPTKIPNKTNQLGFML